MSRNESIAADAALTQFGELGYAVGYGALLHRTELGGVKRRPTAARR